MAAAPEEFLFVHPEPASPSVFVDLPPTPRRHQDEDPGAFDDMVLPHVARLLMEEEAAGEESFFYQYPDHPALLQAQLPFAQILAEATTSSGDTISSSLSPDTTGAGGGGGSGSDSDEHSPSSNDAADMFLKGMQEATKFLPTIAAGFLNLDHSSHARGRKNSRPHAAAAAAAVNDDDDPDDPPEASSKIAAAAAPEPDEGEARKMFDEMMLGDRDICMKGVQHHHHQQQATQGRRRRRRGSSTATETAVDLHELLLRCAQAVSADDRRGAQELLAQIRRHSSPTGDAAQRLAHCFAEGLEARMAGTGSRLYRSLMVRPTSTADFLRAYQLFMAACCCKKVAFAFSNKTIFDAVSGRRRLHIVDYGIGYGFQWPGLLRGLAGRPGGPPEVRITGIDLPQPGFRPAHHIDETGRRLATCARELGVPFAFRGIAAPRRETVSPEDLHIAAEDEVLVVSSLCHFRHLMMEDGGRRSPRDQVLGNIRRMRPDVFIHGVINGGYGTGYFPTRFRELLFHYAAQFELLDATVPRHSRERMLVERDILGRAAINVIACEGADRVERPETYRLWQARNRRAGLAQLPLRPEVVRVVLDKVRDNYHSDFVVDRDHDWLLHRWKGRVLYGLSTWAAAAHDAVTSVA
ncbi:unnamed protein product [Urochloa humidicola]